VCAQLKQLYIGLIDSTGLEINKYASRIAKNSTDLGLCQL